MTIAAISKNKFCNKLSHISIKSNDKSPNVGCDFLFVRFDLMKTVL